MVKKQEVKPSLPSMDDAVNQMRRDDRIPGYALTIIDILLRRVHDDSKWPSNVECQEAEARSDVADLRDRLHTLEQAMHDIKVNSLNVSTHERQLQVLQQPPSPRLFKTAPVLTGPTPSPLQGDSRSGAPTPLSTSSAQM